MPATYIFRSIIFADTVNSCTAFGLAKVLDSYGDSFPISHYKDFSFERHEVVYIYIYNKTIKRGQYTKSKTNISSVSTMDSSSVVSFTEL